MNTKIRDATAEDAAELSRIYSYYVLNTAKTLEYTPPGIEEFRKRIVSTKETYPYLVAEYNGKTVGYCYASAFRPRIGYKHSVEVSIYTDKDFIHKGCGKLLYEELEKRLIKIGIKNMNVCIVTSDKEVEFLDKCSLLFHEKMGFCYVGTFHKVSCKFGRWFDMTWMEKHIGKHE